MDATDNAIKPLDPMKYLTLPYNKKLNLLREHCVGCEWPDLDQEHWCLHCSKKFNGHSARVWQDEEGRLWLECGTPDCDGSPIDWAPYPWWDPDHPETKTAEKGDRPKRRQGRKKGGEMMMMMFPSKLMRLNG